MTTAANRVMQSYGRCCANPAFFDTFYQNFLTTSPMIASKFQNTDMKAQKQLLRAGILNLVLFARGMSDAKLRALGESHSRTGFDIRPEMYDLWMDALIRTIRQHDLELTAEDVTAWQEVLTKGVNIIKSYY